MFKSSLLEFSNFFCQATKETIKISTGMDIHVSKTYQKIPHLKIAGDIGSFVTFSGDYNGILIMNFTGEAAVEIVATYLRTMGMPDEEIPGNHTSDDVRNNIGEIVNQIIGKTRQLIQNRYDLAAKANIPAIISITTPIGLVLESSHGEDQECLRISLSTPTLKKFHIELMMESLSLIEVDS